MMPPPGSYKAMRLKVKNINSGVVLKTCKIVIFLGLTPADIAYFTNACTLTVYYNIQMKL